MQRYYDQFNQQLIYIGRAATEHFWDAQWQSTDFRKAITKTPNSWIARTTKKYLPLGSHILEGGCGQGNHVYALQQQGFKAVGLDYAPLTVEKLWQYAPELTIKLGDVRELPFPDNSFDGYWSLGVIEHFWDGYDTIANEIRRVIKPGGYLFLTFPCMSFLRIKKAQRGLYPYWENGLLEPDGFYQFALNPASVNRAFSNLDFHLIQEKGFASIKGIKDEVTYLEKQLQIFYDSRAFTARVIKRVIDPLLLPYLFGHSRFMILKKK